MCAGLAGARNHRTETLFARDEAMLVDQARRLSFQGFERCVQEWLLHADPDGADRDEMERRDRRQVSLDETFTGMFSGHLLLDPVSGTIVADELRRLEQDLFETDWAQAKTRMGREPLVHELARTPGQRRADALVAMAERSTSVAADAKKPRPLFTVVVGAERFLHTCHLASGRTVSPAALVDWLPEADLEALLFDALGERAIKATRQRSFTGVLRRILEVRDQHCTGPCCEEPPNRCQGDHIIPYDHGGITSQHNGRLACGTHNRANYTNYRRQPSPHDDDDGYR